MVKPRKGALTQTFVRGAFSRKGALIQTLVCPPFGVCGQGFPLAILRLPGRPYGAGLRRSRAALAPGCHGVPAGPSGRLREGKECSGHYHPLPHSVTCHVWPLTLPARSRPLSKQTGTAQSRCSTRASAERERRRPPVGVWWGVVIARTSEPKGKGWERGSSSAAPRAPEPCEDVRGAAKMRFPHLVFILKG